MIQTGYSVMGDWRVKGQQLVPSLAPVSVDSTAYNSSTRGLTAFSGFHTDTYANT